MKRQVPDFASDAEAEAFIEQDLSDLDFTQFKVLPADAERSRIAQLKMRVPRSLLDAIKLRARQRGIPYARYIRELIERDVSEPSIDDSRGRDAPPISIFG